MNKKLFISQINENLDGDTKTKHFWNSEGEVWEIYTQKEVCGKFAVYSEQFTEFQMDRMKADRIEIYCFACNKAFKYLEADEIERLKND